MPRSRKGQRRGVRVQPWNYRKQRSTDVDEHAACLSHWEQRYEQLSPGRFDGVLEELWIGPLQVFRETTMQALVQQGTAGPHALTLALPVGPTRADAWFCGRQVGAAPQPVLLATGEFELATRGPFDIVAVGVSAPAWAAELGDLPALPGRDGGSRVLPCAAAAERDDLRDALLGVLASAGRHPSRVPPPAQLGHIRQLLHDLLAGMAQAPARGGGTAASRQRIVRAARRYMAEHADQTIDVPTLCAALHVSRRTLQYAFEDVLQMGPVAFLRALRLNGMRRDLRRGGDEPVADRAARWGFWHLSRFAADYRLLFGERPSETLRRARAH